MTLQLLDGLVLRLDMFAYLIDLLPDVVEEDSLRLAQTAAQALNTALELVDTPGTSQVYQALRALVFQKY